MPKLNRVTKPISMSPASAVNSAFNVESSTRPNASTRSPAEGCIIVQSPSRLNRVNALTSTSTAAQCLEAEIAEIEIEAQNQADIVSAMFLANYYRQNDRPRNTKVNYALKQRVWKE